jgi:hypothetical protein
MALIELYRGTDFRQDFHYVDENDEPIDLTGRTFSVFEVSRDFRDKISIIETDLAGGVISIRIEWVDTLSSAITHKFRLSTSLGEDDVGSELIEVLYK